MSEKQILSADDIRRAITRVAHEVAERNEGVDAVVLVGIRRRAREDPSSPGTESAGPVVPMSTKPGTRARRRKRIGTWS